MYAAARPSTRRRRVPAAPACPALTAPLPPSLPSLLPARPPARPRARPRACAQMGDWINKYDTEVREKVSHIKAIKKEYDEEKRQLRWYAEYFERVEAELMLRQQEERRIAEEKAKEEAQKAMLDGAASVIQRIYRGRVTRRELEKAKKGKGKKGKGGKGGKGKKGKKK